MSDTFAVFGNPIEHSKSPIIHHQFAEQFNLDIKYHKILSTEANFADDIAAFFHNGGSGCNVTVPFKEQVFGLCNVLTPQARRARAVNTVYLDQKEQLCGHNTDGIGFVADLTRNHAVQISGARVLIVGAGGATRGILAPIIEQSPAAITIANRTLQRADNLAGEFADLFPVVACAADSITPAKPVDILINATSASLSGEIPVTDATLICAKTVCYDLAYAIKPTTFMQWAAAQGARRVIDGKGMLVEQAASAFFTWTGHRPATDATIDSLG